MRSVPDSVDMTVTPCIGTVTVLKTKEMTIPRQMQGNRPCQRACTLLVLSRTRSFATCMYASKRKPECSKTVVPIPKTSACTAAAWPAWQKRPL